MPRRTALIVPVPEAEPEVGELRLAHDPVAALGVPAHITVLFPFLSLEEIDEGTLRALCSKFPAFDYELDRVERFPDGGVWIHPEPSLPFVDLTAAVWQRWPACPPYEGAFDEVIPHLTVSKSETDVQVALPIRARAAEVLLLEEQEADGRWAVRLRIPLA